MAYTTHNFKTKKELREWVKQGNSATVFQPGPFGPDVRDGRTVIKGPHGYHLWYAQVEVKDNEIIKFIK